MTGPWPRVPLAQVLRRSEQRIPLWPEHTYKLITVRLWGKGLVLRGEAKGAEISSRALCKARAGQLVLSKIDARNGAIGLVPNCLDGSMVTNDFPLYDIDDTELLPTFLEWLSKTRPFTEACRAASEGTTNRIRLKDDRFLRITVPLPPLREQRRIVVKLDTLAAKVEEARELRRVAVLAAQSSRASMADSVLSVHNAAGVLGDVLTHAPRNGWSTVCDNMNGGTSVLSIGAVTGFAYRATACKITSAVTDPAAYYWLQSGDLLMSRSNSPGLVGHAAIYDGNPAPCIYPDLLMRLDVDPDLASTRFVWHWLQSSVARDHISTNAKGTSASMKKISQRVVMGIPFPKAIPLSEQHRLVAHLDRLQAMVDQLQQLQAKTAADLDALMPSVLDRAFKGEL